MWHVLIQRAGVFADEILTHPEFVTKRECRRWAAWLLTKPDIVSAHPVRAKKE